MCGNEGDFIYVVAEFIQFGDKMLMQNGPLHSLLKNNCKYLGNKICVNLLFQISDKEQFDYYSSTSFDITNPCRLFFSPT